MVDFVRNPHEQNLTSLYITFLFCNIKKYRLLNDFSFITLLLLSHTHFIFVIINNEDCV